jgi:prepilin-type N-terminal cleavage/methylation domain-containing protein
MEMKKKTPNAQRPTPNVQCRGAFTLIELLVVIAIIAVLLGLVFPVFQGVPERAKKVQAKNDLTQVVTAVNAYYTEYGKYPVATDDSTFANTSDLFYTLRAVASGTANSGNAANTRQIVFISPAEDASQTNPKGKIGKDGQFYDPWGQAYRIAIDGTYDSQIANPYTADAAAGPGTLRQGVIAWSVGKDTKAGNNGDNKFSGSDDVISWQ